LAPVDVVQDPDAGAVLMEMVRAAMVVLDFLPFVPVTVTQAPGVTALRA
jgi:hypothetical protein